MPKQVTKKNLVARATKMAKENEELKVGRAVTVESGEVFILQRNVPVSGTFRALGPHLRYPFNQMNVGDSFEVKTSKEEAKKVVSRLSSACAAFVKSRNSSAKFTVRRTTDVTARVWRLQ